MSHEIRTIKVHVGPENSPVYDERGFSVEIEDDAGGEIVVVNCHDDQCAGGQIRLDPSDWPALREAISRMVQECREYEK